MATSGLLIAELGGAMHNERGFTLLEAVVVVGVIGLLTAVALPGMQEAMNRNRVITGSELVAAQLREARLAAITRNAPFRLRFNCPEAGAIRMLAVTGSSAIDSATDRCTLNQPNDGPVVYLPQSVRVTVGGGDTPPTLEISGRGQISAAGGTMPLNLAVRYGTFSRVISITATGRVRTPTT
jgi:prepilin-type N-terminal cleavage/methylation domain-containing protein